MNIIRGSELYDSHKEYWKNFVLFTKHMSLARTIRTLTIMGRSESEEKIDLSKLLYPPMQAVDIHTIDVDIAHAGMDQRKIHMLVREIFPKMKWKVPIAVHHGLLPGLTEPVATDEEGAGTKMSKSKPMSGVFIHDTNDEIKSKIKKGWCEVGKTNNLGRRRLLQEIKSGMPMLVAQAERIAINMPIQGTASDIIKIAMVTIGDVINNEYSEKASMLLQVHDELLFEVDRDIVLDLAQKFKKIMESSIVLDAPLIVEAKMGDNWEDMDRI